MAASQALQSSGWAAAGAACGPLALQAPALPSGPAVANAEERRRRCPPVYLALQLPRALACVAAAAALCAATLFSKYRQHKAGALGASLRAAAVTALAGAAGWFGGQAAATVAAGIDPRLGTVAHCCAAVLSLGIAAAVA